MFFSSSVGLDSGCDMCTNSHKISTALIKTSGSNSRPVKLYDFTSLNMNRWLYEMLTTKHESSPEMCSVYLKARSAFHFSPCFINFTSTASGQYLSFLKAAAVWLLSRIFPLKPVPCGCAGSICRAHCNELVIFFTVEEIPVSKRGHSSLICFLTKDHVLWFSHDFYGFIFCRNDCWDTMAYGHIWTLICEQKAFFPPLCPLILHHPIITGGPHCVQFIPFGLSFCSTGVKLISQWNISFFIMIIRAASMQPLGNRIRK